MQKKVLFTLLLVLLALAAFWFWPKNETATVAVDKPQPEAMAEPQQTPVVPAVAPVPIDQYQQEELKQSFSLLSQAYAADLSYPSYSRPLTSADHQLLNPNYFDTVALPLEGARAPVWCCPNTALRIPNRSSLAW